ncbi:MAG: hypothetical protein IK095_06365 [Oscillospiraceae bacterium]|nr:hypothetical protein [Oscillospiraceae bacterium]
MDESVYLFETIGEIADRYVLEAGERLRLWETKSRRRRRLALRTLLIAAAIAALMGVTAYAMGLLGLTERIFPVAGTELVVLVPNGLKGTETYAGNGEWWSWAYAHRNDEADGSLEARQLDEKARRTCALYGVKTAEAADELYRIAGEHGLQLYSDYVTAPDRERLYALTGMRPFLTEGEEALGGGYVFADGSFKSEGRLCIGDLTLWVTLTRFSAGTIYPFCGAAPLPDHTEETWNSAQGQTVDIVRWQGERTEIWYLSADGETFVALKLYSLPEIWQLERAGIADREELARIVADRVDFAAICARNAAAQALLDVPRGAEANADALQRLQTFYDSPVFAAAREFQSFFTATFYGASFTGVHGQEGYEDIDRELERLSADYGLRYATGKTVEGDTVRYDNGVWQRKGLATPGGTAWSTTTWYIPKDALCTGMVHYVSYTEYQRVWTCETAEGQRIVCATDGPEKISGSYLFYETETAWVLVRIGNTDPAVMEQAAEDIDWSAFG